MSKNDLTSRISILERQDRRFRWLMATMVALFGWRAAAQGGAAPEVPDEVRAKSFVLVAPDGAELASWRPRYVGGTEMVELRMEIAGEGASLRAVVTEDQAGIVVTGPEGQHRAHLSAQDSDAALRLSEQSGRSATIGTTLKRTSLPYISLEPAYAGPRIRLGPPTELSQGGDQAFGLFLEGEGFKRRGGLWMNRDEAAHLAIWDGNGEEVVRLPPR